MKKRNILILLIGMLILYGRNPIYADPLFWEEALEKEVSETPELVKLGKQIYENACFYCHGEDGKGEGTGRRYLFMKPRDFTAGKFKIRTTPTGSLPTNEDLFRTITVGFPEYRMPNFKYLTTKERWALVYYIKTLSPFFKERKPEKPIVIGEAPPVTAKLLAQGKELYNELECWKCHGKEGRGDGPSALDLKDDWGNPLILLNLNGGSRVFKGGARARDIMRTFLTGMTGTPMPSYADSITKEQAWALSSYIEDMFVKKERK